MRDTDYAREIARAIVTFSDGSEGRMELLFVKQPQQEEIRFSWWKGDNMMTRPFTATEEELLTLLKDALQKGVLSEDFRAKLREIL